MKKTVFIIFLLGWALTGSTQKLIDIYKKGTVRLVPDAGYAKGNDWNRVFRSYYDTLYGKPMGNRKSLLVLPNGSVVVNHRYSLYYTLFNANGSFEKEFPIRKNGVPLKKFEAIEGIINNNTFFTGLDNMGMMNCFDFSGNFIKTLKMDYMTRDMIPLPNGKIAVVGWVIWKDRFRDFVAVVDYQTNAEKIIWEHFTNRCSQEMEQTGTPSPKGLVHCKLFNYGYFFKERGGISFTTMPFSKDIGLSSPPVLSNLGNNLIISLPETGEILVYDLDGNLKSKDKIGWATNFLSVREQQKIQQRAIDRFKNLKEGFGFAKWVSPEENRLAIESIIKEMESDLGKIKDPIPIPVFSTIIKDTDGNLLFFEYPREENANKFNVWVYKNKGKFICQSSFVCDEYDLNINPSKMVFYKGYIYGLQLLKKADGVPLRLIRFKLVSQ